MISSMDRGSTIGRAALRCAISSIGDEFVFCLSLRARPCGAARTISSGVLPVRAAFASMMDQDAMPAWTDAKSRSAAHPQA
jgi:hypothetical protein